VAYFWLQASLPRQLGALRWWQRRFSSPLMTQPFLSRDAVMPMSGRVAQAVPNGNRAMRLWLIAVAAMVMAMVVVGGATRLTGSGLSITEWQPIVGVVPPLSDADWQAAFEKYEQIPQYKVLNKGMTLEEFKPLFWWEWAHRILGRLIGVVFALPFAVFLLRGDMTAALWPRLVALFALGGLQGAIGWYMVASGLEQRTEVSQYRLALHLGTAVILLGAILWVALELGDRPSRPASAAPLRRLALAVLAAVFLQILLGALVAGLGAGHAFNTWPLMDGRLIPHGLRAMTPIWLNPFENVVTVQFDHRTMAYVVAVLALANHSAAWRSGDSRLIASAGRLLTLVLLQIGLGIWALVTSVPLHLALTHQLVAMLVFVAALVHFHRTMRESRAIPNDPPEEFPSSHGEKAPVGTNRVDG
jgi:cytochrome c oxidase assembly protein subunit 15